ncbi:MAG: urate hydroxylase PuuD [Rhodospirillaceae bacterium]|nr:urate hydroxylase PuuD [Rhodospirillaceae bacterium]
MTSVLWEWASLAVRWLHVIAGIAWIGSSFYFIALDLGLRRRDGLPEGAAGEAWQVHGGGFYNMVKYLVAPARLPDELTWFKWEAYTTWLSGMGLLVLVYYMAADLYLIDRSVLDIPPWIAVAFSLGALMFGWTGYDLLCRSRLGRNDRALAAVGFVLLVALAWAATRVFSGRGAVMQMGALIGTLMVANVFFVIIPNQRKVVADLIAGRAPDPALGRAAKQRSLHNNYLTLPVVFVMIANHYPLAFASRWNWLILAIVLVVGAAIRHFFNARHKGAPSPWWCWGVAVAGMAAIVWLTAQPAVAPAAAATAPEALTGAAEEIVLSRCSMCHAAEPVWAGLATPPKGVVLESPAEIRARAREIALVAAHTRAMPPGNVTGISEEERGVLAAWAATAAPSP